MVARSPAVPAPCESAQGCVKRHSQKQLGADYEPYTHTPCVQQRRLSLSLTAKRPWTSVKQPSPLAAQPKPLAAQSSPLAAQPLPMTAQPSLLAAQPQPLAAQPSPLAAQPSFPVKQLSSVAAAAAWQRAQENMAPVPIADMCPLFASIEPALIDDSFAREQCGYAGDKEHCFGAKKVASTGSGVENAEPQSESEQMRRVADVDYEEAFDAARIILRSSIGASRRVSQESRGREMSDYDESIGKDLSGSVSGLPIDMSLVAKAISAKEAEQILEAPPQEPRWGGAADMDDTCWKEAPELVGPAWGLLEQVLPLEEAAEPLELITCNKNARQGLVLQVEEDAPLAHGAEEAMVEETNLATCGLKSLDHADDGSPRDAAHMIDVADREAARIGSGPKRPSAARPNSLAALISNDAAPHNSLSVSIQLQHVVQVCLHAV